MPGATSLAARISGGASFGRDAQNFLVGGLPWVFSSEGSQRYKDDAIFLVNDRELLKTLYFSEYLTPLRGTQLMEMVGNRALLMNLEFRFPFLIYYFPALGMLGQLSGVLFIDASTVWAADGKGLTGTDRSKQSILTYGWGPRFVLFGLPLQLDYAWQYKPPQGEEGRNWYLTIGFDF